MSLNSSSFQCAISKNDVSTLYELNDIFHESKLLFLDDPFSSLLVIYDDNKIEKDNNDIQVGDYITLGEDKWVVYEISKKNIKLTTADLLDKTYRFDLNSTVYNPETVNSIGYYLNNTYYNSLSYKDKLIESEWYVSNYKTSYKDVETDKVKAKVGLLNVSDLKLNSKLSDYFLLNGNDTGVYLYGNELITSKVAIYRSIRPAIMIKKSKVASGNGSIDKPFILEG